jgi:hypothetical protein
MAGLVIFNDGATVALTRETQTLDLEQIEKAE